MDDKKKIQKRNVFIRLTRKMSDKEFKKQVKKLGRDLTKEEKNIIMKRNARRVGLVAGLIATFSSGFVARGLLDSGRETHGVNQKETEISIDAEELNKEIKINNISDSKNVFLEGLKVGEEELKAVETSQYLVDNTTKEVEDLKDNDEVILSLKNMFAKEYNNDNIEDYITHKDIKLERTRGNYMFEDKDINGEKIYRQVYSKDYEKKVIQSELGIMKVCIQKDGEKEIEGAINNEDGTYVGVYSLDDDADSSKNTLVKLGKVIDTGIDYGDSLNRNDIQEINMFKNKFISALVEYKQSKINEIVEYENRME